MSDHAPDPQQALARLEALEALYRTAEARMEEAESATAALEAMSAAMTPLMAGYHGTWLKDLEATAELDPRLAVAGEDTIWDLHGRQHELMVRLMRLCARYFAG